MSLNLSALLNLDGIEVETKKEHIIDFPLDDTKKNCYLAILEEYSIASSLKYSNFFYLYFTFVY